MENQIEGMVREVEGKVQDGIGSAMGDAQAQFRGTIRRTAGRAQQSYGEALDSFREAAISNPGMTLGVVAGVSFILGALWARRD